MRIVASIAFALGLSAACAHAQPLEPNVPAVDFGTIVGEEAAERTFTVTNRGSDPASIRNVKLTPPLSVVRMKAVVDPGQSADIVVRFGTPRPAGTFEGELAVSFEDDSAETLVMEVRANLVPTIEVRPRAELVVVTERGVEVRSSVDIVSHLKGPLEIRGGTTTSDRYSTKLETLEAGRRYRLSLVLSGRGASGARADVLTLGTDNPQHPEVKVGIKTMVRDRVYTFPDRLELGRINMAAARSGELPEVSLMVYQKGGRDFAIKVSSDVPFLTLKPEKSATYGDRWQIFCSIDPARLTPGHARGTLTIETSDKEFPKLEVPVEALVE